MLTDLNYDAFHIPKFAKETHKELPGSSSNLNAGSELGPRIPTPRPKARSTAPGITGRTGSQEAQAENDLG